MKQLFQDPELQARFARDGFVVLPFLPASAIADIRDLFEELHPDNPTPGFYSSTFSDDTVFKRRIFERVDHWYHEPVAGLFQDYKKLGASFLLKQPGERGRMPIHQDWTVSEEAGPDYTVTMWVPLQDVEAQNGAIKVLPGSHRFSNALRGPSLPVIWREVYHLLEERMQTLEMKAGEAFIFNHSLLHSSHDNQTESPRLAVTYGLAPSDTDLIYYWQEGERIERIFMGDELFMRYHNIGERPSFGSSQGFFHQDLSPVSEAECRRLLSGEQAQIKRLLVPVAPEWKPPKLQAPAYEIFPDEARNQELANEGHVVFPLLDEAAVKALRDFYFQHHPQDPAHFYASSHVSDLDFRTEMHQHIQKVLAPLIEKHLPGAQALGGSFIAKPKGNRGILPPHADWNIVDEREYRSFNLWIPLVDTTEENGAVYILPNSHLWHDSFRGPGIPNVYQALMSGIWPSLEPLEMKAGQALLYDHRLVHASPENKTEELRLACVYGIIPQRAEMRYYCLQGGLIKAYRSNVDFFLQGEPEAGPGDLEFLEVPPYEFPKMYPGDLRKFQGIEEAPATENLLNSERNFWQTYTPANIAREVGHRLRGLFGSKAQ